jgi:hypothetical protein
MINIPNYLPIYMLLAVILGFLVGWACGDEYRRRVNAEDRVDELRDEVEDLRRLEKPSVYF